MVNFTRIKENPFFSPNMEAKWETCAAFNPCVVKTENQFHLLYRAQSSLQDQQGAYMSVSSIGYAVGNDGIHFSNRKQLIKPEKDWEKFGCEDPRVTWINNKYYIFYTALSTYPFSARGIKVGVAVTKDFQTVEEKHLVTPFNAKAMALFPDKINGKMVAILTVHTDIPPAKIALAFFDDESQIWSEQFWTDWYLSLDSHVIPLLRSANDHLEIGAPPIKTKKGWLLIHSYIQNYFSSEKVFGIEAVLLDLKDPSKVIGRTSKPLLVPEKTHELHGDVPNVIFPSGALLEQDKLYLYYGAADTTCCLAIENIDVLLDELTQNEKPTFMAGTTLPEGFTRYSLNPIIAPRPEFTWEAQLTFNPAAIYEGGKVHIVYRAMSFDDTSLFGYASSKDGVTIDERLSVPIYVPRVSFEQKTHPGNSGCEDPRITKIDDRFYMFYTAYDGYCPRVAMTSIKVDDFLNQHWDWAFPKAITPPGKFDKDACLFPRKIKGKYALLHREGPDISMSFVDNLLFDDNEYLEDGQFLIKPKHDLTGVRNLGIASTPIETKHGWLLFYHWVTSSHTVYKAAVALLDLEDPTKILNKTDVDLLEPEMDYEKVGIVPNVVFPCGTVILDNDVYLYYGGADKVIGVAKMELSKILEKLGV